MYGYIKKYKLVIALKNICKNYKLTYYYRDEVFIA